MKECPKEHCFAPEISCNEGHLDIRDCPHYTKAPDEQGPSNAAERTHSFPWTANSFGLSDLQLITSHSKPLFIGLIGPFSSGKTTVLAITYLLLYNGHKLGSKGFAGSLTLTAWEQVSSYLKFRGHQIPSFPPHTPIGQGRVPGLLHLLLRRDDDDCEHWVLTDPPGEWFEKWALNADDEGAKGARWIADNASHFAFFIDSDLLAGEASQKAKLDVLGLAERLASVVGSRPVAVVWSKSDRKIDPAFKGSIKNRIDELFSVKAHFDLSIMPKEDPVAGCASLWTWLTSNSAWAPPDLHLEPASDDFFLSYRGGDG